MCTQKELSVILENVNKAYHLVYGNDLVKVLLYGSYARGEYDKDSDIDIVAIVHGKREDLQKKLDLVWEVSSDLELEYETIVSPTVIPYDEFEKYRRILPYYRNIQKEGVELGK